MHCDIHTAAGDTAGIVGDNVDDPIAGVVCDVVKEQAEADDDVNLAQRAGMLAGTTLQGTSEFVPNEVGAGKVLLMAMLCLSLCFQWGNHIGTNLQEWWM